MSRAVETKRHHPRIKRRLRVHYGPPGELPKRHASITGDVSETGLYVQALRVEPPGTRLDLDVALPDGEILLKGIVVWSREGSRLSRQHHGGFGIWLLDPPEAWRRHWRETEAARATGRGPVPETRFVRRR